MPNEKPKKRRCYRKVFIGNSKTSKEYSLNQNLCLEILRETFSPDWSWLAGAKFGAINTALLVASAMMKMREELEVGEGLYQVWGNSMKAARIHNFGGPEVIVVEDIPVPIAGPGEVLVRVAATGVGPWDALIREGKSNISPPPPLTLGSDLSGLIEAVGPGVTEFKNGDEIYGVTNPQFCGANAEYALAFANMIALKPLGITDIEAASVPVVAVTAWQMLFDYAHAQRGQTAMILGAAGNVGAYAVQLAARAGLHVIAVANEKESDYVRSLGAEIAVNSQIGISEDTVPSVDLLIDTVGGETRERLLRGLKPGGVLVSVVSSDPPSSRPDVRTVFFYVEVTTERLNTISKLFDSAELQANVGSVLPLKEVRTAHEMLAGAPHKRGKIVLKV
jgi:NADPH:quinone reductase-like Zn-dependent oxidoreductase